MISVVILTLYDHAVAFDLDILCIADNRDIQMFGDLRANLRGIAIDRLTACDDQIVFQIADRACQCLAGSPCIRAAEYSVCHKDSLVCAHCQCLAKHFLRLGQSHCHNGNFRTILIF